MKVDYNKFNFKHQTNGSITQNKKCCFYIRKSKFNCRENKYYIINNINNQDSNIDNHLIKKRVKRKDV